MDAEEVKAHVWFKGVNWDDIYNRKNKPPMPKSCQFDMPAINTKIEDTLPKDKGKDYVSDWSFVVEARSK